MNKFQKNIINLILKKLLNENSNYEKYIFTIKEIINVFDARIIISINEDISNCIPRKYENMSIH